MKKIRIDIIAGARPNFMKIAPIISALNLPENKNGPLSYRLVHTGQHYDQQMSAEFFTQLGIPDPDVNLEVGSGTQAEQTAAIMLRYEKLLTEQPADICLVVGDVNSTMACAIVAKKTGLKVAHVEGGIRSGDWAMPEEINRVVTDSITDYYFTTSEHANQNLRRAGVTEDRIFFVGNTMIDSLKANMHKLRAPGFWQEYQLEPGNYLVLTLHRPANVDNQEAFQKLLKVIGEAAQGFTVIFPAHPRTAANLSSVKNFPDNIQLVDPLGYLEFNYLVKNTKGVLTDSGGVTEETTYMGIPCLTLRSNTERPETIEVGTNELVGTNTSSIASAMQRLLSDCWKKGRIPEKWDGKAAIRIVSAIRSLG